MSSEDCEILEIFFESENKHRPQGLNNNQDNRDQKARRARKLTEGAAPLLSQLCNSHGAVSPKGAQP